MPLGSASTSGSTSNRSNTGDFSDKHEGPSILSRLGLRSAVSHSESPSSVPRPGEQQPPAPHPEKGEVSDLKGPIHISPDNPQLPSDSASASSPEWERCVHPEGWVYYYLVDKDEEGTVEYHEIRGALKGTTDQGNPSATIPAAVGFGGLRFYIFIDHTRWYAARVRKLLDDDADSRANELQYNYWEFIRLYPAHLPLPPGAVTAACQALHCYVMEGMTRGAETLAPFNLLESQELLHYLKSDQTTVPDVDPPLTALLPSLSARKTSLVSWILVNVVQHRISSRYGRKSYREGTLVENPSMPTVWFTLISAIFLFAPLDQRMHIHAAKIHSDLRGDIDTWPTYVETLVREWSTFNLAATVLLSASVGFLGIPGIGSVTRTVALLSVIFTLGSIMTSVYLLWRHQGGRRRVEYNISLLQPGVQVNSLAIILSLPFASLTWGVILFLVSVMLYSFYGFQSTSPGDTPVRGQSWVPVLSSSLVVVVTTVGSFAFFRFFRRRSASLSLV